MSERFAVRRPDRPEVEVRAGGSAVEARVQADIVEVDVAEEVNRHARCVLLVQNWDPDTRTVRWSDGGPFAPGTAVEVLLGYHSDLATVFDGVVTALAAHFPAGRPPLLRVEARSRSAWLAAPRRSRVLEEAGDGDLAQAVAADYGLDTDVEDGPARPAVVQGDRADWDHLVARATELGWVTYVRGTTLVLRPPAEPADPIALTWTLNLTELHLTQDVGGLGSPVTVTGWDPEQQEAVTADADAGRSGVDTGDRDDHSAAVDATGWALRPQTVPSPLPLTAGEADALASGAARQAALRHLTGSGRTIGTPALRCDAWVSVTGVGDRFAGPHYVSAVRHRMSARGYTTEFQLGLPAPLAPAAAPPAYPLATGVVTDLDDPLGWGRVKVSFPWRTDAPDAVWARLATVDAGPDRGTFFLPDPGQEVLVGFLGGDAAQPVVLGSLWHGQAAPPVAVDPDTNDVRALVTRAGHALTFDDKDGGSVTLSTKRGHRLVLSEGDGKVTLSEPDGGNEIALSGSGIELTAASGDITLRASSGAVRIDATTIEGTASGTASIESSASLDIKASATLDLRGALVNIN
ncbi:phage baseplate assembly protein V [Phytohabitans suffuscus]|uniref:Gp5/Type VI secretion system Vgr protein OB-fold domain-containing protein n=1 Tax=Phytohabitans suffuscus TaxID=624315 RepID=A0A6F8YXZ2_9ACTN|nr:phage baseplate assembly protein V [Phytohabitans suffuscus]BCB91050.1 hypothetical protein Psuf_083630 [Phytohabitans suffuscus]